ncbi:hypothetical protein [Bradyrhizobium sp.]|uniref:hypothetical protein n=1 Tax=Bradyrhizobium sp. TaxID=376 RepID=UPI003C70519A
MKLVNDPTDLLLHRPDGLGNRGLRRIDGDDVLCWPGGPGRDDALMVAARLALDRLEDR